jgi:hypothetical protein
VSFFDIRKTSFVSCLMVGYLILQFLITALIDFNNFQYSIDVQGYAETIARVAESSANTEQLRLYFSNLPYLGPAHTFNNLGISPIHSLQITSQLYGFFSLLLFVNCFRKLLEFRGAALISRVRLASFLSVSLVFFPSRNIWIASGLRESVLEFSVLLLIYVCIISQRIISYSKINAAGILVLLFLSMWIGVNTRISSTLTLCIPIITYLSFKLKSVRFLITFSATLFLSLYSSEALHEFSLDQHLREQKKSLEVVSRASLGDESEIQSEPVSTLTKTSQYLVEILQAASSAEIISANRQASSNSKFWLLDCRRDLNSMQISLQNAKYYACKFANFFLKFFNSWLRPILLFDKGNVFILLASIENVLWLFMIWFTIFSAKPINVFHNTFQLLRWQLLSFLALIAQFQGNFGTSFRHKAFLVPVFLLFIFCCRNIDGLKRNVVNS